MQKLTNYPGSISSPELDAPEPEEEDAIRSYSDNEWEKRDKQSEPTKVKPVVKSKLTVSEKGKEVRLRVTPHRLDPTPHSKHKADVHTSPKKVSVAFLI